MKYGKSDIIIFKEYQIFYDRIMDGAEEQELAEV